MEIVATQSIVQTISKVMAQISKVGIAKLQKMEAGNTRYKYRGIDDMYNGIGPILAEHGLVIIPDVINKEYRTSTTKNGGAQEQVYLDIKYTFMHVHNGQTVTSTLAGQAFCTSDKGTSKAYSMAYKYLAIQVFAIPVVGSDDQDASAPEFANNSQEKEALISYLDEVEKRGEVSEIIGNWFIENPGWRQSSISFLNTLKNRVIEIEKSKTQKSKAS